MPAAAVCQDAPKLNATKADPVSPSALTDIIRVICEQIDHLMASYRRQMSSYENWEKITLFRNYQFLLESIQTVVGASYWVDTEKGVARLKDRCEQLSESLENRGLKVVEYTTDCPVNYFE